MATEDKGVIVDRRCGGGGGGADVAEAGGGRGVGADGAEVEVVERGLGGAVEGGEEGCELSVGVVVSGARVLVWVGVGVVGAGEGRAGVGVPCYADAVDVEEPVASGDLVLGGDVVGVVREEVWEVVLVHLLGEGVGLWMGC